MKTAGVLVILTSCVVAMVYCSAECRTDNDCKPEECCVFVMGRYGATVCQRWGGLEDTCRRGASPVNKTVSDPGSPPVEAIGVHYMLCPCTRGLACDNRGRCVYGLPQGGESHPAQVAHN